MLFRSNARRGQKYVPLEALVLIIGLSDRALGASVAKTFPTGDYTGALIILALAILIIASRHLSFGLPDISRASS